MVELAEPINKEQFILKPDELRMPTSTRAEQNAWFQEILGKETEGMQLGIKPKLPPNIDLRPDLYRKWQTRVWNPWISSRYGRFAPGLTADFSEIGN